MTTYKFLTGGDISLLTKMESLGQIYRDNGAPRPLLTIFRDRGCNILRVRLWVNPSGVDVFVNDLIYVTDLGRRIKERGFLFYLSLQYSDEWTNPGVQTKPRAWAGLSFDDLAATVEDYTASVITKLGEAGAMPDFVQIGNEITSGILWPDGQVRSRPNNFNNLSVLLKRGIEGVVRGAGKSPLPSIVLHVDRGGDWEGTEQFFDEISKRDVPYEYIGLSFYPFLHGPLDGLKTTVEKAAKKFGKPIIVAETMYPYRGAFDQSNKSHPPSPEAQSQYLADLIKILKNVPMGLGKGVLFWAPEWLVIEGLRSSWTGRTLFDSDSNALPALTTLGAAADPHIT